LAADRMLAASDFDDAVDMSGRIILAAGSFTAGTPSVDAFALYALRQVAAHARTPFVAALPKRVLSLERGALAWIGHADRVWDSYSTSSALALRTLSVPQVYAALVTFLASGLPTGRIANVAATLAASLAIRLEELEDEIDTRGGAAARELAD